MFEITYAKKFKNLILVLLILGFFQSCSNISFSRKSSHEGRGLIGSKGFSYPFENESLEEDEKSSAGNSSQDPILFTSLGEGDPLVQQWVEIYSQKSRRRFLKSMELGEKYRKQIEDIFIEENVPKDIFYLGLVESGFALKSRSRAKAVGPWQFIKGTARKYGLIINKEIDDREDLVKSTRAAARYLKDLFKIFENWELALSAYNAGEARIQKAIQKGKTKNYLKLSQEKLIPEETQAFIPKILAAKLAYTHLLPSLNHNGKDIIETKGKNFYVGQEERSGRGGQELPEENKIISLSSEKKWKYVVKKGDSLVQISKDLNLPIEKIVQLNQLESNSLTADQILFLPFEKVKLYVVKKGDSLRKIARQFGIKLRFIRGVNSLFTNKIYPKQKLIIPINS